METHDIRWQQCFQNFRRAFTLLREAMENDLDTLNQLNKEGIIQRFEYTFELAWKVLKDKIEFDGLELIENQALLEHIARVGKPL
jgi:nucleotidyltransferase substrate binding protein (TIGR01987 family)